MADEGASALAECLPRQKGLRQARVGGLGSEVWDLGFMM